MDEHTLIAERERAHQAKHLLENTLYLEAKSIVLNNLTEAWQGTSVAQADDRERIYHMLVAARSVFDHIDGVMQTGKLAQIQLNNNR